jgi:FeS assembly SUF system regulator
MIKISKLVDYSVLVLCQLASAPTESWSANRLAEKLGLNQPTLAKICRLLAKADLLSASRGAQGGYVLNHEPQAISLHRVIIAVDGDNDLVCCEKTGNRCPCIANCHVQPAWQSVDAEIKLILQRKTIADFSYYQKNSCPMQSMTEELI